MEKEQCLTVDTVAFKVQSACAITRMIIRMIVFMYCMHTFEIFSLCVCFSKCMHILRLHYIEIILADVGCTCWAYVRDVYMY